MTRILDFNEDDWKEIHDYLKKWNESKFGGKSDYPDNCNKKAACYSIPMLMATLKSAEETKKLSNRVLWLTYIIIFLASISLIKDIWPYLEGFHN